VSLILTSDNDEQSKRLSDHILKEIAERIEWNRIPCLMLQMGKFNEAEEVHKQLLGSTSGHDLISRAKLHNQIEMIMAEKDDQNTALLYFEKALNIRQELLLLNHPDLAISYNNLGLLYESMGKYSTTLSHIEKALEIQQQSLLPTKQLERAGIHSNIGSLYHKMGQMTVALPYFQKVLETRQYSHPLNHPDVAKSPSNIVSIYNSIGEPSKALSYFEKALEFLRNSLPPNHPDIVILHNNIGTSYQAMSKHPFALVHYDTALEILQKSRPNHPYYVMLHSNLATVYVSMFDYKEAIQHQLTAVDIAMHTFGSAHSQMQMYRKQLEKLRDKQKSKSHGMRSFISLRHLSDFVALTYVFEEKSECKL
jgi:tetratricopeptide (TPR) repeat protein